MKRFKTVKKFKEKMRKAVQNAQQNRSDKEAREAFPVASGSVDDSELDAYTLDKKQKLFLKREKDRERKKRKRAAEREEKKRVCFCPKLWRICVQSLTNNCNKS